MERPRVCRRHSRDSVSEYSSSCMDMRRLHALTSACMCGKPGRQAGRQERTPGQVGWRKFGPCGAGRRGRRTWQQRKAATCGPARRHAEGCGPQKRSVAGRRPGVQPRGTRSCCGGPFRPRARPAGHSCVLLMLCGFLPAVALGADDAPQEGSYAHDRTTFPAAQAAGRRDVPG
jgi:hypothetical protein